MPIDPALIERARAGDRETAETLAQAIAHDARSKRELAAQRTNVVVGTAAIVAVAAVCVLTGLNRSAFGVGVVLGLAVGFLAGIALGARQRHSSRKQP